VIDLLAITSIALHDDDNDAYYRAPFPDVLSSKTQTQLCEMTLIVKKRQFEAGC
jgi:hypothetical protein